MKKKLKATPPGISLSSSVVTVIISILVCIIIFHYAILSEDYSHSVYGKGPEELLGMSFRGLWVHLAVCIGLAVRNYSSFYSGSRSIYLMKRTGSASELHRMCLTVPLAGAVCGILLVLVFTVFDSLLRYGYFDGTYILDIWRAMI